MTTNTSAKWKLAQNLELKWWKNYLKNKDRNQYLEWKCNYWSKFLFDIDKYVELPEHASILDIGCGPAGIFMNLKGNHVIAADSLMQQYVNNNLLSQEKFPWVQFEQLSMEALHYTEKFDYIFCLNAINHVNNIEKCYDNLYRALKPNGFLIISTDAHKYHFLKKIFQWIPGDMLHPVQLDIYEYLTYLTSRNMTILDNSRYATEAIFDYYVTIAKK